MKVPWHISPQLEPRESGYLDNHRWACHLILMDGIVRRAEENPPGEPMPPTLAGWATHRWIKHYSMSDLRREIARVIHAVIPPATCIHSGGELFSVTYPLFRQMYACPLVDTADPAFPVIHQLPFLRPNVPLPLSVLLSQTGLPHVLIAVRCLAHVAPVINQEHGMTMEWWLFLSRQLLEWKVRCRRLAALIPEAKARGLDTEQMELIQHQDWFDRFDAALPLDTILWELDHGYPPRMASAPAAPPDTYQVDWFERSWHPGSLYRRRRRDAMAAAAGSRSAIATPATPAARALAAAWQTAPHIAQAMGMLIEQGLILRELAPLTWLFYHQPPPDQLRVAAVPQAFTVWDSALALRREGTEEVTGAGTGAE